MLCLLRCRRVGRSQLPRLSLLLKFPRITHDRKLENTNELTREFFQRIALEERLARFNCNFLQILVVVLLATAPTIPTPIPSDFRYAVEVRNLAYFDEQEMERELDTFLRQHHGWVPSIPNKLMASQNNDSTTIEAASQAQGALALHTTMSYRYCVLSETQMRSIIQCYGTGLNEWLAGCVRVSPFVFLHTPDDVLALN